jgi:hypothetical protein
MLRIAAMCSAGVTVLARLARFERKSRVCSAGRNAGGLTVTMPTGSSRRMQKLDAVLPVPPVGSRHWLEVFAGADFHFRLSEREPDFAGVYAAYAKLKPPYGDEAERLYRHLAELFGRADEGVPPCSVAECAALAAWLAAEGESLPTIDGWKKHLDLGDGTTTTLYDLTWRLERGPAAAGSGGVAESIRKIKVMHTGGGGSPVPAGTPHGAVHPTGAGPSVVRDDSEA